MTAPKRRSLVEPPSGNPFAKLGEQVVAVFRERHQFNPGIRSG
jgi:hypothetical protein